jgi:nickel-dependent lactate racemase
MACAQLRFGTESQFDFEFPEHLRVEVFGTPSRIASGDTVAAAKTALRDPVDYPSLVDAIVTGDRVALAVDREVPEANSIVAAVVDLLLSADVKPENVRVVHSASHRGRGGQWLTSQLADDVRQRIAVFAHDPLDRERLAYLAVARDGEPVYVNRAIADADVVIPIGCLRPDDSLGYLGAAGGLYPAFGDEKAQRRFQAPASSLAPEQLERRRGEADEAVWLLGTRFTIQVVPGGGDRVGAVLAGDIDAVASHGRELAAGLWHFPVLQRASLVVTGIDGGPDQQTWENVARSVAAALRIVDDDGDIVVCSSLTAPPGPALSRMASAGSLADANRQARRARTADALPAVQLVQALERARVYLLSGLPPEVVEGLGLGHVARADEIVRLSRHHSACILLANSQYAIPTIAEESFAT